jgi:hypothetical protein
LSNVCRQSGELAGPTKRKSSKKWTQPEPPSLWSIIQWTAVLKVSKSFQESLAP